MRKFILFFILACLHLATRGQTVEGVDLSVLPKPTQAAKLQYWFDDDKASLSSQTQISGTNSIDVSSLLTGVHTIHYQIIDDKGMIGVPYSALFIKMAQYQFEANGLLYWFNDDEKSAKRTSLQNGMSTIDVSDIGEGLHTVHYQILDSHNMPSYIASAMFMKTGESLGNESLRAERLFYWYDDEDKLSNAELSSGINTLDASHLSEGLHTLHYQVLCNNGSLTAASSAFFYRLNSDASSTKAKQLRYWYDDQTSVLTTSITNGTQMLDVSGLLAGIHVLHYQIVDDSGALGVPSSTMFMKMDAMDELAAAKSQRYWFDDDENNMRECAVVNGVQELDVKNLEVGFHTLHYQLVDAAGNVTVPYSNIFMKTPEYALVDGINAITRYQYWINDDATLTTVNVEKPTSPYQLISLLPMPKAPIRSSSFHFEPKDGEPMIYAKNYVHFRFHDAAGYWADEARSFVDYSVSQKVTDVTELAPTQTFDRPNINGIKWFKFEAEEGDTIAFCCNQATSLQVFAPSGEEIYSTAEDKSVQYGGVHTWEDGTYYVAVHDVTGSRLSVTLNYMHMDKYDVVDQDVRVVGNGGCSTITFQGNGFKDLYAVDLYTSNGDSIHSIDIGHESDASTSVTFDFTDVELGKYNAVFHFSEEDKEFADIITVEEAKDIELAVNVEYPSRFLRGTSAIYTVNITNKGNMTAYYVPTELRLSTNQFSSISSVIFKDEKGNHIDELYFHYTDEDSIDVDLLENFRHKLNEIIGLASFAVVEDTINNCEVGFSDRYFTISPLSTITYVVEVKSSEKFSLYVSIPSKWFSLSSNNKDASRRKAAEKDLCCEKEKWECVSNNLTDALSLIAPPGLGCALSIGDFGVNAMFEIICANGSSPVEKLKTALTNKSTSLAQKVFWAVLDCVSFGISKKIDKLKNTRKQLEQTRKFELNRSVENHNLYHKFIQEYDDMMYKAEDLYKKGKITEAEKIEKEAKSLKHDADMLKIEEERAAENAKKLQDQITGVKKDIDQETLNFAQIIDKLKSGLKIALDNITCSKERLDAKKKCNDDPDDDGGDSDPVNSLDPNDIYGYVAHSGSKYISEDVVALPYRIEFENDTTFATASAHTVIVKDTLDATKFDLSSYLPTSIKIGDKDVQLNGDKQFVTTVDMRPSINVIAQVEGMYDEEKGIAAWKFTSLDPMTMEETDNVMQGFLPVNFDGNGIGEVAFNINRLQNLVDGTEINNKASIVFDTNDAIETPVWTNTTDVVPPVTHVRDVELVNDSTIRIHYDGTDNRSGIWKYALFAQYGEESSWFQIAETDTTCFDVHYTEDVDYGFCVVATDSAGNVEKKVIQREYSFLNEEGEIINGVSTPHDNQVATNNAYDLNGRLIQEKGYHGIIIKNKKKLFKQ